MTVQPGRRVRLAKIHIAKKQLAMVDDSYRAMLKRITGVDSASACTEAQMDTVLAEFARLGFVADKPNTPRSEKAYVRMIYAIWKDLKPYLTDHSHSALRSFVRRTTGQDAPEFLEPEAANDVIEALKAWLQRERGKTRPKGTSYVSPKMRRLSKKK